MRIILLCVLWFMFGVLAANPNSGKPIAAVVRHFDDGSAGLVYYWKPRTLIGMLYGEYYRTHLMISDWDEWIEGIVVEYTCATGTSINIK